MNIYNTKIGSRLVAYIHVHKIHIYTLNIVGRIGNRTDVDKKSTFPFIIRCTVTCNTYYMFAVVSINLSSGIYYEDMMPKLKVIIVVDRSSIIYI